MRDDVQRRPLRPDGFLRTVLVAIVLATLASCNQMVVRTVVKPEQGETLDHRSPYLKAHLKNGGVAVLANWSVPDSSRVVIGQGVVLSPNRDTLQRGSFSLPIDSVALFETNVSKTSPAIAAMAVVTGVSAAVTILCLSHPKTCFGSCPTFYWCRGNDTVLVAEGFSSSVAPSLERTDIDALYRVQPESRELQLRLTNEALETHVIRQAILLAVPKPTGGRVLKDRHDVFWAATDMVKPDKCFGPEGSCLAAVQEYDGIERFSLADSTDLASKETLSCEFEHSRKGGCGLVIASRQTLLSTYLFYQSLAYMGTRAGDFLSQLERGSVSAKAAAQGPGRLLGGMEIEIQDSSGGWRTVDTVMETGPLASDVVVVPLPETVSDSVRCRIRLNQGLWRIDYLALASLSQATVTTPIEPSYVLRGDKLDTTACRQLSVDPAFLISMPGDQFRITYALPECPEQYEYFLSSRGYYLEWMRQEWMNDGDIARAAAMFINPRQFLKDAAPEYKETEKTMEQYFWGSRFAH
jgi:hypothetical protein